MCNTIVQSNINNTNNIINDDILYISTLFDYEDEEYEIVNIALNMIEAKKVCGSEL